MGRSLPYAFPASERGAWEMEHGADDLLARNHGRALGNESHSIGDLDQGSPAWRDGGWKQLDRLYHRPRTRPLPRGPADRRDGKEKLQTTDRAADPRIPKAS